MKTEVPGVHEAVITQTVQKIREMSEVGLVEKFFS